MDLLEIRPAVPAERQPLFALHEELFRGEIEEIWGWDDASQWRNFLKEWAESETFVIYKAGRLVGCVQYFTRTDHLYLFNLMVEREFQSQGIGSEAVSWLKGVAREKDTAIGLQVLKTNPRVLEFYQRQGFEVVETVDAGLKLRWDGERMR
ncbi:GNAT family N-acetyltransferase [Luteolibacter yonseiensis]|uniref:GNAT family N-acetyltransferase n=1 Tax=Luteolibacter yonseiensis TaxID=1144680 RepID=A0A934R2K7_9BACT|nr:GNAT family N-acetyltransferase [Luteolibacter yonseiensis]MBK1815846.1 GNAT family N-acetyltransferase [Luteolibacter yonseiensis]